MALFHHWILKILSLFLYPFMNKKTMPETYSYLVCKFQYNCFKTLPLPFTQWTVLNKSQQFNYVGCNVASFVLEGKPSQWHHSPKQ